MTTRTAAGRRSRSACLVASAVVIAAGLGLRLLPLELPRMVTKYGGSLLWGAMVWLLVAASVPRASSRSTTCAAIAIAIAIEGLRLCHWHRLDAIRAYAIGRFVLGRVFSPWNIAAYVGGMAGAVVCGEQTGLLRRRSGPPSSGAPRSAAGRAFMCPSKSDLHDQR